MASEGIHRPSINEIRNTFHAMMYRLEEDAQTISDELVRKSKLVQLEILRTHSGDIGDPKELSDFCLSTLATMKCSIDAARLGRQQSRSIEKVLKGIRARDRVDLSSIMFEGIQELGAQSPEIEA